MLHQIPERPSGVFVRIRSKGIRIHVSRMLSEEGGKVLPSPPEGTGCCDFCTHKELRKAHNPEIINADRKNSIIIQENLKNRSRQENEQQCAK